MAALHDELLDLAAVLAIGPEPGEAYIRRSISTAYYALFHLLVYETTLNWGIEGQRNVLARAFDHGPMKKACDEKRGNAKKLLDQELSAEKRAIEESLAFVADTFVRLQAHRHEADYDVSGEWSDEDAAERVLSVQEAFWRWNDIRETPEAQDFLLSLFVKKR